MPFTEKDIPHLALVNAQGKGWYYKATHSKIIFMLFVYLSRYLPTYNTTVIC